MEEAKKGMFSIKGQVKVEAKDSMPGDMKLDAYVFDSAGALVAKGAVDDKGNFNVNLNLAQPANTELVIGPKGDPKTIRQSSAYIRKFSAQDWTEEGVIKHDFVLARDIWWSWRPVRVCVAGHVHKVQHDDSTPDICPVPFVKVEVFDVDRESCLWPLIRRWWDMLLDRPVIRIPELLKERPIHKPFPEPDPAPDMKLPEISADIGGAFQFESAPYPNIEESMYLNPQPEPPTPIMASAQGSFSRVGEAGKLSQSLASRFDNLTITSKVAPWLIFPRCFYSRQLIRETYTDCNGYFRCCFNWWPFHFRRGRLRFDSRPDIIIRVTQIINGVETVIYMDPYSSTRWNVTNAHIDLFLDNEDIRCGSGCTSRPEGSEVFFTRIGDDEVYQINQGTGLYNDTSLSNVAYGGTLLVYGQFGDDLADVSPARYYRLSYAKQGSSNFKFIDTNLGDIRVNKGTLKSSDYALGPKTVNGVPSLYEVRDHANYYWYNPDWIGTWHSWLDEEDTGKFILRLEVFDENGVILTTASGKVDYIDGTVPPSDPPVALTHMTDHCDLVITLDNKPPVIDMQIPAVLNECGVIPWSAVPPLNIQIGVSQENGRLHSWGLQYTKGVNPAVYILDSGSSNTGAPASVSKTVDATNANPTPPPVINMLSGVAGTCAFALKLSATAHVRDGRTFIYYREQIKAVAIEKCS